MKILVVDDDSGIRELIKAILSKEGHEAFLASDGPDAIQIANKQPVDLILLDIRMPNFSGFWFCDAFQKKENTKKIPIIMMSSSSDPSTQQRALKMGARLFLPKPFKPQQLVQAVKKVVSH